MKHSKFVCMTNIVCMKHNSLNDEHSDSLYETVCMININMIESKSRYDEVVVFDEACHMDESCFPSCTALLYCAISVTQTNGAIIYR